MKDLNTLQKEYNEIKDKYMKNHSPNLKEDLKNKLIELDYAFNKNYELELDTKFPMTTTLEKEETRLENLINYVELKSKEQKDLMSSYKKATDEVIELSYLKYSDNLKEYRERLNNVVKILALIEEAKKEKNETKIKVIKNKLLKKEYLNLLYEFCLIDSLEVNDIDLSKVLQKKDTIEKDSLVEVKENKKEPRLKDLFKEEPKATELKVVEHIEEPKIEEVKEDNKEEENKILTSMPLIDKIGSVVPVNVFESLEKAEEKLPDVVLPTNGLKDDQNDIFIDTKDMFEDTKEEEKEEKNTK